MKWGLLLVISAALAVFGVVVLTQLEKEPSYEGISFSEWMTLYPSNPDRASFAIRAMGKEALPFIRRDLRARDTKFDLWLRAKLRQQNWLDWNSLSAFRRNVNGIQGCAELGTNAEAALPELEALLSHDLRMRREVVSAMMRTGTAGSFFLLRAFTNATYPSEIKAEVTGALQLMFWIPNSPDPTPTIRYLLNQLDITTPSVRRDAAEALGWIRQLPAVCIPALGTLISDADVEVRRAAVVSLGRFGAGTKTHSEPLVRRAFDDSDLSVRTAATNALGRLYPPPPVDYE